MKRDMLAGSRVFSGIQPSGVLHIGNYLGAIKQWVELQNEADEAIFCVVDLHAITVLQDPKKLEENILSTAALFLAAGVNPEKSALFVQSTRPEHTELAWILNCYTKMGELNRMTQFKDKAGENQEKVSVGLYDYPVLMAADILLYQATHVPVGDDQKQHIEITRDIAERVNSKYGKIFTVPEPVIGKSGARIMGLDDPAKKMCKSAESEYNYIALSDNADLIRKKIQKAVTDSGDEIKSGEEKPAMTNLLNIYSEISGKSVSDLEKEYTGKGYGEFKKELAEAMVEYLAPIQKRYDDIVSDKEGLKKILTAGSEKIAPTAQKTLSDIKKVIGLGI